MSLHSLSPERFSLVTPLFESHMQHHLFCAGVLTGKYDGRVFVDDPVHPGTALVVKDDSWWYLAGAADNDAFNQAIGRAIIEKQFISQRTGSVYLSAASTGWDSVLSHLIEERPPIVMRRRLYEADNSFKRPEIQLPDGFTLHFMDEALPGLVAGDLPPSVSSVLDLRRQKPAPDEEAFGYVILHEAACIAHAMVDCIVDGRGDIGLVTENAFRRRGFGTAAAAATIAYGLAAADLQAIHWDCMKNNYPSVNLAEKLQLQLALEHSFYVIIFDSLVHFANVAWNHLDEAEYEHALAVVNDQIFNIDAQTKHGHFIAGAAWAGLGNSEKAFYHLNAAVDNGWSYSSQLFSTPAFKSLYDLPEWHQLIGRFET